MDANIDTYMQLFFLLFFRSNLMIKKYLNILAHDKVAEKLAWS